MDFLESMMFRLGPEGCVESRHMKMGKREWPSSV